MSKITVKIVFGSEKLEDIMRNVAITTSVLTNIFYEHCDDALGSIKLVTTGKTTRSYYSKVNGKPRLAVLHFKL